MGKEILIEEAVEKVAENPRENKLTITSLQDEQKESNEGRPNFRPLQ